MVTIPITTSPAVAVSGQPLRAAHPRRAAQPLRAAEPLRASGSPREASHGMSAATGSWRADSRGFTGARPGPGFPAPAPG